MTPDLEAQTRWENQQRYIEALQRDNIKLSKSVEWRTWTALFVIAGLLFVILDLKGCIPGHHGYGDSPPTLEFLTPAWEFSR